MALKKSQLYSSLWQSCDELRGGMATSQYKDYVLTLLFMKYISDKRDSLIEVPRGSRFADMVALRGDKEIGDDLLGDAYEYLMRHFATESDKSKGQFYTPAEASRHDAAVADRPGAVDISGMPRERRAPARLVRSAKLGLGLRCGGVAGAIT
ncbi:type I restriction enzyme, modification chain [Nitrococcus mobilis Nb-231]|uniref:site-specific DNA-methyltransferase (adenine-specific) n=1 Tax=Nitrococcus mobilis Nb-231 TaxID=314278 RepID=A4BMC3_9GAMM|nr:N-6 DNA methylase [Nitrococcus mobilis]EAR23461.1 type I restriction enzyme, modification chain [Nitrococcus mobilis Nb-231]